MCLRISSSVMLYFSMSFKRHCWIELILPFYTWATNSLIFFNFSSINLTKGHEIRIACFYCLKNDWICSHCITKNPLSMCLLPFWNFPVYIESNCSHTLESALVVGCTTWILQTFVAFHMETNTNRIGTVRC